LEVRIPNELWVYSSDLRILRELVNCASSLPMYSQRFRRSDRQRTGLYEIEHDV
jgi:hypothetical protein